MLGSEKKNIQMNAYSNIIDILGDKPVLITVTANMPISVRLKIAASCSIGTIFRSARLKYAL